MVEKTKYQYIEYLKLFFFSIYVFFLPIAHTTAIQSISFVLFLLIFFFTEFKKIKLENLLNIKWLLIILSIFILISYISIFYSIAPNESLSEVNSELVRNVGVMLIVFLCFSTQTINKIKPYVYSIFGVIIIHTFINLYTWYLADFSLNVRTGGLLDGYINKGGGERFAIWTTFAICVSMSIFLYKNKLLGFFLLLLSLTSMFSTQTRAGYLAAFFIIILAIFISIKSKSIKILSTLFATIFIFIVYMGSHNFHPRFNIQSSNNYITLMKKSPKEMGEEYKKLNLEYSTSSRISMWKAALIYSINNPFKPTGYGRFLYGKNIVKLNSYENQPFAVYSQVHNEFIGILFSLGIFGLILFLCLWGYFLKESYKLINIDIYDWISMFGFIMFFGGIGFIINLFFGSFFGDSESKFFYLVFGIALAISKNYKIKLQL